MRIKLLLDTIWHLKNKQVIYQIVNKFYHPSFKFYKSPSSKRRPIILTPIEKFYHYDFSYFCFLNIKDCFHSWNQTNHGMLWAYNLNYMDWLGQEGMSEVEGEKWIDKFVAEIPQNFVGQDPYPIALRSINWIKFFCKYPNSAIIPRLDSLYSQILFLEKKLEYKLLGNHLLEDAYALFIASVYFNDKKLHAKALKLLKAQLKEQILPDGAHYEQSPMYHCILLDRLLDCYNFASHTDITGSTDVCFLKETAERMLGYLESIVWADGTIPMLNDSANGIAPTPKQIIDYAIRLGLEWSPIPMKESGYRKLRTEHLEVIVDVGNITATYQPGHTHADTFNYELRVDGRPFVVDTGISTYNKTDRRQLERSTIAHNTVSADGKNSSEVWGGFRVGRRANVSDVKCKLSDGRGFVEASHDGFGKKCWRKFSMNDDAFMIEDRYEGRAVSYIHIAEGADENRITIEGAEMIKVKPWRYSTDYNQFYDGKVMEIHFNGKLRYTIQ